MAVKTIIYYFQIFPIYYFDLNFPTNMSGTRTKKLYWWNFQTGLVAVFIPSKVIIFIFEKLGPSTKSKVQFQRRSLGPKHFTKFGLPTHHPTTTHKLFGHFRAQTWKKFLTFLEPSLELKYFLGKRGILNMILNIATNSVKSTQNCIQCIQYIPEISFLVTPDVA